MPHITASHFDASRFRSRFENSSSSNFRGQLAVNPVDSKLRRPRRHPTCPLSTTLFPYAHAFSKSALHSGQGLSALLETLLTAAQSLFHSHYRSLTSVRVRSPVKVFHCRRLDLASYNFTRPGNDFVNPLYEWLVSTSIEQEIAPRRV